MWKEYLLATLPAMALVYHGLDTEKLIRMVVSVMKTLLYGVAVSLLAAYVASKVFEEKVSNFMTYQSIVNNGIIERVNRIENCLINRTCSK